MKNPSKFFEEMFTKNRAARAKQGPSNSKGFNMAKNYSSKALKAKIVKSDYVKQVNAPEVMIKITSQARSGTSKKGVVAHLKYISRNDFELVNDKGESLSANKLVNEWENSACPLSEDKQRKLTYNLILSMPPGTDRVKFKDGCKSFLKDNFDECYYGYAVHDNTDHPHMHLCIRSTNKNGEQIRFNRPELDDLRKSLAMNLRSSGITANATTKPRRAGYKRGADTINIKTWYHKKKLNKEVEHDRYHKHKPAKDGWKYKKQDTGRTGTKTRDGMS